MNIDNSGKTAKQQVVNAITWFGTPPFYLLLCALLFPFNRKLCYLYLFAVIATEIVCAVIKLITRTERPTPRKRETLYDQYDASTFPSAHTGRIASNMSILFAAYSSSYIAAIGICMILSVGYSRVALKEHFLVDVIVGGIVGIIVSLLIFGWLY